MARDRITDGKDWFGDWLDSTIDEISLEQVCPASINSLEKRVFVRGTTNRPTKPVHYAIRM